MSDEKKGGGFWDFLGDAFGPIGSIVGAIVGSKGNKEAASQQLESTKYATDAQERAAKEALAFEREREAAKLAEHERALAAYRAQWNAREQARVGLLRRYGINASPGLMGGAPGMAGAGVGQKGALTLGQLALRRPGGYTPPTPAGAMTGRPPEPPLALEDWNRWDRPQY